MKLLTLDFLKYTNEHQKSEIDTSHNESRHKTTVDLNVVNSLQHLNFNNLPANGQKQVSDLVDKHRAIENKVQNGIDNTDMNDPSTEIKELQGLHTVLAIKSSLNNKINEIFASHNMPISPDMVQAVSSQNSSLAENKILTNKMVDCVKADLAIEEELSKKPILSLDEICEKKGISKEDYIKAKGNVEDCVKSLSNVDDYADPSLDMPSYMDPED